MSLEEKTIEDKIEILESGHVQVRSKTVILKDGEPIAENYHRKVISPGDDYSEESERVQSICELIQTQEVIDEYRAKLDSSNPPPSTEEESIESSEEPTE
jgi:hypothetical protein